MRKRLLIVLSVFLLLACSVPETKIYSLYMPAGKEAGKKGGLPVAVSVHSPKYLSQPYIASRNSPYQIDMAKYSKWDSPPDQILREALRDSLSSMELFREVRTSGLAPSGFYSFRAGLKRFERSYEGDVPFGEISFDIVLSAPDGKEIHRASVVKKVKLEDKTSLGLAKGLSNALSEAMDEVRGGIAKALRATP